MRYIEVSYCGSSGNCPYYHSDTDFCRHPMLWDIVNNRVCEWDENGSFPVKCPLREVLE